MSGFSEAALGIGRRLASEAIWHEDRCTWVGPFADTIHERPAVVFRSLPADLYSGTAGVGLVLAEVGAVADDDACRRTAAGAVRHALARAEDPASGLDAGLYTGLAGIALAGVRTGLLLEVPELVERGRGVAERAAAVSADGASYDLLAGRAGVIVGLLALGAALGDPAPAAAAVGLGDQLAAAAARHGSWSWPENGGESGLLPAGLSHGAGGVAFALLELAASAGEGRFRDAADGARASEEAGFDPAAGNWPRSAEADGGARAVTVSGVSWCHGAPGIAMERHHAWLVTGDDARRAEAERALLTTARWVRAALPAARGGYSLCHGLAGNAEALSDCADAAGSAAGDLRTLALDVAETGIGEYAVGGRSWPCGSPGGESPGLMLGLAGIARYYLRLGRPALPSLLLPRAGADWRATEVSDARQGGGGIDPTVAPGG